MMEEEISRMQSWMDGKDTDSEDELDDFGGDPRGPSSGFVVLDDLDGEAGARPRSHAQTTVSVAPPESTPQGGGLE